MGLLKIGGRERRQLSSHAVWNGVREATASRREARLAELTEWLSPEDTRGVLRFG